MGGVTRDSITWMCCRGSRWCAGREHAPLRSLGRGSRCASELPEAGVKRAIYIALGSSEFCGPWWRMDGGGRHLRRSQGSRDWAQSRARRHHYADYMAWTPFVTLAYSRTSHEERQYQRPNGILISLGLLRCVGLQRRQPGPGEEFRSGAALCAPSADDKAAILDFSVVLTWN